MDIRSTNGVVLEKGKLQLTSGRGEALAQRLTIRLRTHLNSWFLNTQYGIDYFNRVFEKTIPKSSIDAVFQTEINRDLRVEKILEFHSEIKGNRYIMSFKAKARDGAVSDVISVLASPNGITVNF